MFGLEHLDGDPAVVPHVLGPIDRRHPTPTDLALAPVPIGEGGGEALAVFRHRVTKHPTPELSSAGRTPSSAALSRVAVALHEATPADGGSPDLQTGSESGEEVSSRTRPRWPVMRGWSRRFDGPAIVPRCALASIRSATPGCGVGCTSPLSAPYDSNRGCGRSASGS